ncbi:MAG: hypothetical protein JXQ27_09060 [Acidobacteria bacterium]|nr:hypothetical protein [Acidobacteriota bacterium]
MSRSSNNVPSHRHAAFMPRMVRLGIITLGLLAWLYIFGRAERVAFTHDEAHTYNTFMSQTYGSIYAQRPLATANNHILNTILMKTVYIWGKKDKLFLRLPNVLAFVVYFVFGALLLSRLVSGGWRLAGMVFLTANAYLLEYFALARGYGLSLALLLMMLYFLVLYVDTGRLWFQAAALGCLLPGILANLALIPLGIITVMLSLFAHAPREQPPGWRERFTRPWQKFIPATTFLVVSLAVLYKPILNLLKAGACYYGGQHGFFTDTVLSLVRNSWPVAGNPWILGAILCGGGAVLLGAAVALVADRRRMDLPVRFFRHVTLLSGLYAFWFIAQHVLLGSPYPINRTALPFVPLFMLMTILLLARTARRRLFQVLAAGTGMILTILFLTGFGLLANFTHTTEWPFDADTPQMLADLQDIHFRNGPSGKITLDAHPLLIPVVNFYRQTGGHVWLRPVNREGGAADPVDYLYTLAADPERLSATGSERSLHFYPRCGTVLLKSHLSDP